MDARVIRGVGVLTVAAFDQGSARALGDAIKRLKREGAPLRGYVLDLRNNPGGLLDEAVEVADVFLDGGAVGAVVPVAPCGGSAETLRFRARFGDDVDGAPLVVLTNAKTAAGAEWLAAALVDRGRARTIGQATNGDWDAHTIIPLGPLAGLRLRTGALVSASEAIRQGPLQASIETPPRDETGDHPLDRAIELLGGARPAP